MRSRIIRFSSKFSSGEPRLFLVLSLVVLFVAYSHWSFRFMLCFLLELFILLIVADARTVSFQYVTTSRCDS